MVEAPLHKATVQKLKYNTRGTKLACASSDTTISVLKTPVISKLDVCALNGHNASINSLAFSSSD